MWQLDYRGVTVSAVTFFMRKGIKMDSVNSSVWKKEIS